MTKTTHTPGPWHINGHQIESAPELLEALERSQKWIARMISSGAHHECVAPQDCVATFAQSKAAIAKARGE